jgi:hypothetical protein
MKTTYYTFLAGAISFFHEKLNQTPQRDEKLFEPFIGKLTRIDTDKSSDNKKILEFYKRSKQSGFKKPEGTTMNLLLAEVEFKLTHHDPINKVSLKMDAKGVILEWCYGKELGGTREKKQLNFELPKSPEDVESLVDRYIVAVYEFADAYDTCKKQKSIKKLLKLTGSITDKGNELCMAFIKKNGEAALKNILLCPFENLGFSELLVKKLKEEAGKSNLLEVLHMANINDFQKFKKFGTKPARELRQFLEKNGLDFGMFTT